MMGKFKDEDLWKPGPGEKNVIPDIIGNAESNIWKIQFYKQNYLTGDLSSKKLILKEISALRKEINKLPEEL
jgi:hypothetical protein